MKRALLLLLLQAPLLLAGSSGQSLSRAIFPEEARRRFLPDRMTTVSEPNFAGLTLSNLTEGSIIFIDPNKELTEDIVNLIFNNTTNTLDVNGIIIRGVRSIGLDVSGGTFATAAIVIPDAGNIGSTSDPDAIAIASDGTVTFSQAVNVQGILTVGSGAEGKINFDANTGLVFANDRVKIRAGSIVMVDALEAGQDVLTLGASASDVDVVIGAGGLANAIFVSGETGFVGFNGTPIGQFDIFGPSGEDGIFRVYKSAENKSAYLSVSPATSDPWDTDHLLWNIGLQQNNDRDFQFVRWDGANNIVPLRLDNAGNGFVLGAITAANAILNGTTAIGLNMTGTFATAIQKWPAGTVQTTGNVTFQSTVDSTTAFQFMDADGGNATLTVDTTNELVMIGNPSVTPATAYRLVVASTNDTDYFAVYHNNGETRFRTSDGAFTFQTDEGTNKNTQVQVKGKGTGYGELILYDEDNAEFMRFNAVSGGAQMFAGGAAPTVLRFQHPGDAHINMFAVSLEGSTQTLDIYGFRTGDSLRSISIGVGVDAADTASFDGLSNYWFDGNIQSTAGAQLGDGGVTNYTQFAADGDLKFVGTAGIVYGHMYTNNEPIAVTLVDQNTWYELDGANAWTTGLLNNCSFTDPAITVLEPGIYEVTWSLSTDFSASPGAKQEIEYGIMIGGSIQNEGQAHRTLANSTDTRNAASVALLDLADNAVISLAARNITSAGKVLHVEHGNMTVKQIGGT